MLCIPNIILSYRHSTAGIHLSFDLFPWVLEWWSVFSSPKFSSMTKQSQKLYDCGDFYSLSVCASVLTKDFDTFPRLKVTNETRAPQFVRDAQILAAPHEHI